MPTFPKSAKLCRKLLIEQLFAQGKHFVCWPLRIHYIPAAAPTQVLIWAPKALFKHATDRNRLRRQMREAYRLNQDILGEKTFHISVRYMDANKQSFATIQHAMRKALYKLQKV